jgi:peptide/nickel transport system permease protein
VTDASASSQSRRSAERFFSRKSALIGLLLLFFIALSGVFAPFLTPYDQNQTDVYTIRTPPSKEHLLGADDVGRDVLTRLLYASRISLLVGFLSMLIQVCIGVLFGVAAGYFSGAVDLVVSRFVDLIMCFPFLVIVMTLISIIGTGTAKLALVIGFLSWPSVSRIVRNEVLQIRKDDFILSAKAMGLNSLEIITRHILPNILSSICVASSLAAARGILAEAAMSFLGIGIMPPAPSWGNMLKAAANISVLKYEWWLYVPPAVMVALTVLSIHGIAEGFAFTFAPRKRY